MDSMSTFGLADAFEVKELKKELPPIKLAMID
jgi:hypothetical protein